MRFIMFRHWRVCGGRTNGSSYGKAFVIHDWVRDDSYAARYGVLEGGRYVNVSRVSKQQWDDPKLLAVWDKLPSGEYDGERMNFYATRLFVYDEEEN